MKDKTPLDTSTGDAVSFSEAALSQPATAEPLQEGMCDSKWSHHQGQHGISTACDNPRVVVDRTTPASEPTALRIGGYPSEPLQVKIDKAIAMLKKNIDTVPPHGCQRDEVLAVLEDKPGDTK